MHVTPDTAVRTPVSVVPKQVVVLLGNYVGGPSAAVLAAGSAVSLQRGAADGDGSIAGPDKVAR